MRYTARQGHYVHGCGRESPKKGPREGEKQIWSQEVAPVHPIPALTPRVLRPQPRAQARFAVTFQHPPAAKDSPLTRLGNPGRGREERVPWEAGRGVCQSRTCSLTPTPPCPGLSASWAAKGQWADCLSLHVAARSLSLSGRPTCLWARGTNTGTEKRRGRPTVSRREGGEVCNSFPDLLTNHLSEHYLSDY